MSAELELEVVTTTPDRVEEVEDVVIFLVGEVLFKVVLEILVPLEEIKLDIITTESCAASSFDRHISIRAVLFTL